MTSDDRVSDPLMRWRIQEPRIAWRRVMDDMVLLDVERSVYHGLNRSAALVWDGLAEECSVAELIERVAKAYPDDADKAGQDVPVFLGALLSAGLIEPSTATQPAKGDDSDHDDHT